MGVINEYKHDYDSAVEWYGKSLKINPNYEQAKSRLAALKEKMGNASVQIGKEKMKLPGDDANKTIVEEGQVKQVKWFTSNVTFSDVVGMKDQKQLIHDNIILAMTKPDLLRAYGKKLGLGALFYGPPGCGKCVDKDTMVLLPDGRYTTIEEEVVDKKEPYVLTLTEKHKLAMRKCQRLVETGRKANAKDNYEEKQGSEMHSRTSVPFQELAGRTPETLKENDKIGVPRHICGIRQQHYAGV